MYTIYCDNNLLHSDFIAKFKVLEPKLELEINKAGKLTFTIYPNHVHYSKIQKMKSIITVYNDDLLVFRGRVLESEQLWMNQKHITCEGELAFLNDSIVAPYNFSGSNMITVSDLLSYFINSHNNQVDSDKQFKVGVVSVSSGTTSGLITRSNSDYSNTWKAITDKLIDYLGGYLVVRHEEDGNYIDYLGSIDTISSQPVEFGSNLLDISQTVSADDMLTGIIPLGAKDDSGTRITIESVNDGKNYLVNEQQAELYGRIFQTVIWDDVTKVNNLYKKAVEYVKTIGTLNVSIEVKAVDIASINRTVESFRLGEKVKVVSSEHGINDTLRVEKLSLNLVKPESNTLTLNSSKKTLTDQNNSTSSTVQNIGTEVSEIVATSSVVLWSGYYVMKETDRCMLTRSIRNLLHGIVLIFKKDNMYISQFISKDKIGVTYRFMLTADNIVGYKTLTINESTIAGTAENNFSGYSNGVVYNNHLFVLSSVIGI